MSLVPIVLIVIHCYLLDDYQFMHEVRYSMSDPVYTGVLINGFINSLHTQQRMMDGTFT